MSNTAAPVWAHAHAAPDRTAPRVDDADLAVREEVAAAVALRPGARLEPEQLRAGAKERLSAYKVPHLVAFVDELPEGATGKILKRAIDRELFAAQKGDAE